MVSRKKTLDCFDCLECDVEKSDNMLIYPNPVSSGGLLTLEGVVKGRPVFIYNQLGACVLSTVATGEIMQLSLNFPPGIYLIRNEEKIVKVLIIKNNSSMGFGGDAGVGYTAFFNQNWGIHIDAGLGFFNVKNKIDDFLFITPDQKDCEDYLFDLHTTLHDYQETHKAIFLTVPLMLQ